MHKPTLTTILSLLCFPACFSSGGGRNPQLEGLPTVSNRALLKINHREAAGLPHAGDRFGATRSDGVMAYRCSTQVGVQTSDKVVALKHSDHQRRVGLDLRDQVTLESEHGTLALVVDTTSGVSRAEFALGNASLEYLQSETPSSDAVSVVCNRLEVGGEASRYVDPVRPPKTLECRGEIGSAQGSVPIHTKIAELSPFASRKRFVVAETSEWTIEVWSHEGRISIDVLNRMDGKVYYSSQLFGTNPTQPESVGLQATLVGNQTAQLALKCRF